MITFQTLWSNHPGSGSKPCDEYFENQCAIRMSISLQDSGVSLRTFKGTSCWFKNDKKHPKDTKIKHVLRARELADWLKSKNTFGTYTKYNRSKYELKHGKPLDSTAFQEFKGILFINDGWTGGVDHIDLWNGTEMKAGDTHWLTLGDEIWFWEMERIPIVAPPLEEEITLPTIEIRPPNRRRNLYDSIMEEVEEVLDHIFG